jgi:phosphoserine phosphatase
MGDEAELMKLAKDKSKKKLSEVHIYSDGEGDLPLLTPETVLTQED